MSQKLQSWLSDHPELDGFLVSAPANIYYLAGFSGSFGFFLVSKDGQRRLITDGRYAETALELAVQNDFQFVPYEKDFTQKFGEKLTGHYAVEDTLSLRELDKLKKLFPHLKMAPQSNVIEGFRRVKTADEIAKITTAQAHVDQVLIPFLRSHLKTGISEQALNFKFQQALQAEGRYGLSFPSIIAFGENSSRPHHVPGDRKLQLGDNLLVDCGVTHQQYCSDMTRNFVFGTPNPEYVSQYQQLLIAQQATQSQIKAGASSQKIDAFCRTELGHEAPYFTHSLGHGVGLEIHELPTLSARQDYTLQVGEVVTNEPGLYYPERFGIRIEDLLVVTDELPTILSQTPRDLLSFAEDGPVQILVSD